MRRTRCFAASARMLDLPAQDLAVWEAALRDVAGALDPGSES